MGLPDYKTLPGYPDRPAQPAFIPPSRTSVPLKEFDPTGASLSTPGTKADGGKSRPTLILRDMARALSAVIKIATDGAAKYTAGGWVLVPNGEERYEDAHLRHMLKRFLGESVDPDSESLHLAHEAWGALAKLDLYLRKQESNVQT